MVVCGQVALKARGLSLVGFIGLAEEFWKRKLSFPVSSMWQWWVRRSSSAVVIFGSPDTLGHSEKLRLVVMTTLVRS